MTMRSFKVHLVAVPALLLGLISSVAPEAKAQGFAVASPNFGLSIGSGPIGYGYGYPAYGYGFGPSVGYGFGYPGYGYGYASAYRFGPTAFPAFINCHRCGHRHHLHGPCWGHHRYRGW